MNTDRSERLAALLRDDHSREATRAIVRFVETLPEYRAGIMRYLPTSNGVEIKKSIFADYQTRYNQETLKIQRCLRLDIATAMVASRLHRHGSHGIWNIALGSPHQEGVGVIEVGQIPNAGLLKSVGLFDQNAVWVGSGRLFAALIDITELGSNPLCDISLA